MKPIKINIDSIYPVGSIYFTTTNINPHDLFGGTWERYLQGRMPIGYYESDIDFSTVGALGGEKTHLLTSAESGIPININVNVGVNKNTGGSQSIGVANTSDNYRGMAVYRNIANQDGATMATKRDATTAHNNLPPYIVVYIWRRIA